MTIRNLHLYRALRGGVWERTRSCGWYQVPADVLVDRKCRIPPGVTGYEDHRQAHGYVLLGLSITVAACVAALTIAIKGV